MNKYDDVNENEIIYLLCENDDDVKDIIYNKYGYIIDVIIYKYHKLIKMYNIDEAELRQEASCGFSDAISSFSDKKNASLKTFITICVERKVQNCLKKYTNSKSLMFRDSVSLDKTVGEDNTPLIDLIKDEKQDPLDDLEKTESLEELIKYAKEILSDFEYLVFTYMVKEIPYSVIAQKTGKSLKQIDNTIQRVKVKLRSGRNIFD